MSGQGSRPAQRDAPEPRVIYVVEVAKGAATTSLRRLSAADALQDLNEADALGLAATCTDAAGNVVSRDHLRQAAGRAGSA